MPTFHFISEHLELVYLIRDYLHRLGINPEKHRPKRTPGSECLTPLQIKQIKASKEKLRVLAWRYKISIPLVCRIQNADRDQKRRDLKLYGQI